MSDATVEEQAGEPKRAKWPLILGIALLPIGGAGGYFAAQSGLLGAGAAPDETAAEVAPASRYEDPVPLGDVGFVDVPAVVINSGTSGQARTVRLQVTIEVPAQRVQAVTTVVPRVQDVLNSYLRALDPADFERPGALDRVRGQLLRRVKLVAGDENVRDLLVLEFIVN